LTGEGGLGTGAAQRAGVPGRRGPALQDGRLKAPGGHGTAIVELSEAHLDRFGCTGKKGHSEDLDAVGAALLLRDRVVRFFTAVLEPDLVIDGRESSVVARQESDPGALFYAGGMGEHLASGRRQRGGFRSGEQIAVFEAVRPHWRDDASAQAVGPRSRHSAERLKKVRREGKESQGPCSERD